MEGLFPKSMITDEIKNEIDEDEIKRKKKNRKMKLNDKI